MDERQMVVCAIALFCDGYSPRQVAVALNVDRERAQQLIRQGVDEQAAEEWVIWSKAVTLGVGTTRQPKWHRPNLLRGGTAKVRLDVFQPIASNGDIEAQGLAGYRTAWQGSAFLGNARHGKVWPGEDGPQFLN